MIINIDEVTSRIYSQQPGGAVVREHAVLCCSTRRRREQTAGSLLMIHCRTEAASGQTKEGLNRLRNLKVDRGKAFKTPRLLASERFAAAAAAAAEQNLEPGPSSAQKAACFAGSHGTSSCGLLGTNIPSWTDQENEQRQTETRNRQRVLKAENYPFRFVCPPNFLHGFGREKEKKRCK